MAGSLSGTVCAFPLLKSALLAAGKVIVGVRVRPHDGHIWQPVAACSGRVIYCSGPEGAIEYATWAKEARVGNTDLVCDGFFREEFERLCEEVGLCATRN